MSMDDVKDLSFMDGIRYCIAVGWNFDESDSDESEALLVIWRCDEGKPLLRGVRRHRFPFSIDWRTHFAQREKTNPHLRGKKPKPEAKVDPPLPNEPEKRGPGRPRKDEYVDGVLKGAKSNA